MVASATTPPSPTWLDRIFRALGFLALVAVAFSVPEFPAIGLDSSWRMALGRFFLEGRQFGQEVVFTYGPLGFAMGKTYSGDLWGWLIGWHVVQAVVFAAIVYWHAFQLQGYARVFCLVFFLLFGLTYQDAMHQSMILLAGMAVIRRAPGKWDWRTTLWLALLAVLALVKFTNLLLALFLVLLAGGLILHRDRSWRAGWVPGLFLGLFLLGWVACRQNPLNLPAYFYGSWQISQGYQDSMGLASNWGQLYRALAVAALIVAYLALNLAYHPRRWLGGAVTLGALAYLYLNWKHGFIRADGHQIGFYYAVLTLVVTSPLVLEGGGRGLVPRRWLLTATALLSVYSMEQVLPGLVRGALAGAQNRTLTHVGFAQGESHTRGLYQAALDTERHHAHLGRIRETVGESTLDVLGFEQAVALYHPFNYQPRPVFQGYSAYTPYLARLNERFFAGDQAPEFVLFKLQTIDGRLPTMDDPLVLRLLAQRYHYIISEQGFTLWRRNPGPFDLAANRPVPLRTATIRLNEDLDLADLAAPPLWAEIDYGFSMAGRLRRFLFRPPLVHLHLTDDRGRESVHRLPQSIGRTGFMLSPIIHDKLDYMRAVDGGAGRRAVTLRVAIDPRDRIFFRRDVKVAFSALPVSEAGRDYFIRHADQARFHLFAQPPLSFDAFLEPSEDTIDGRPVLVMHAPSELTFEVPLGATMVHGHYGFATGAYSGEGRTDGAVFGVYWTGGGETRVLMERLLDPLHRVDDRGLQHFSTPLPRAHGLVTFRIHPGPRGDYTYDWTAWSGIEFK
jgi:hypothetical protein